MSAALVLCSFSAIFSWAQTFSTVLSFDGADGASPVEGLIQGTNGSLYGTTPGGGANNECDSYYYGCGTAFRMTPGGALTTLHSFCAQNDCPDGQYPSGVLVQVSNGSVYGTTAAGGKNNYGTVFKISPDGVLTTLYSFCAQSGCPDGAGPTGLIQATDGSLYGTTGGGGANGYGTVFKVTLGGTETTLYSFCSKAGCADGSEPNAWLVEGIDGNFYGTTVEGGVVSSECPLGCGTVFKMTASGWLTTLHSFCSQPGCPDGMNPETGALVQATDGNLYGTTYGGGNPGGGTVFRVTPSGRLTTLYSFCPGDDCMTGQAPSGGLVQATDGNFYGTTVFGGPVSGTCPSGCGTIFQITPRGTLTTLHSFDVTDGAFPMAGLVQDTKGNFYGTTEQRGANGDDDGTIFTLSVGLGPFLKVLPTFGKVGKPIDILGSTLTEATSVSLTAPRPRLPSSHPR